MANGIRKHALTQYAYGLTYVGGFGILNDIVVEGAAASFMAASKQKRT